MKLYNTSDWSSASETNTNALVHTLIKASNKITDRIKKLKSRISHLHTTRLTGGSIWILERIYGTQTQSIRLRQLRMLAPGTVGFEMANMLDRQQYRLIPKFENHDLKHIILGFEMTRRDEIRMQAYLLGNGNYTLPCVGFLSIALIYPSLWSELLLQYKLGRYRKSIYYLTLDDCSHRYLSDVRTEYALAKGTETRSIPIQS